MQEILLRSNSWGDFKEIVNKLSDGDKGHVFELLTKYFLLVDPYYATKLSDVWMVRYGEVPSEVLEHLNHPNQDEGIDLIARTKEGAYWAIQSKYRSKEDQSLTQDDLSSFFSAAYARCKNIDFALVATSTERYSRKYQQYEKGIGFCAADVWRKLDADFFANVHRLVKGKNASYKVSTPRDYQKQAVERAYEHFAVEESRRGKLIFPCGTGKSLIAYWIAQALKAEKTIVAVPSLALLRQSLKVWATESLANKKDMHWICVCSDKDVGDFNRDDVSTLLHDLGVKVHTDPAEISSWLSQGRGKQLVIFTTYQSGPVTAEAAKNAEIAFDLCIMDEAHRTAGKEGKKFQWLLKDENIEIRNRVFMTATERRYRGNSDEIYGMEDEEIYGTTISEMSFSEAVKKEPPILCDYHVVTMTVLDSEIADIITKNKMVVAEDNPDWNEELEAHTVAAGVALRKAMKQYGLHHAISFHSKIERAKYFQGFQENLNSLFGKMDSFHIRGTTPTAKRDEIIEKFVASEHGLITNARCLSEGVDVPEIDCILFADPKRSTIDIVQAVGRAMRPSRNKKKKKARGIIVVPVRVKDDDPTEAKEQIFNNTLLILRALASSDSRMVEYFKSVSEGGKLTGQSKLLTIDVPEALKIDMDTFESSIEIRLWERLERLHRKPLTFNAIKESVQKYENETGKTPSKRTKEDVPGFGGTWMAVDAALSEGLRGLPDDSKWKLRKDWSLSVFMEEFYPELVRKKLTFKLIENAIREYHRRSGKVPSTGSGEVPGIGETWAAISGALSGGYRNLKEETEWKHREKWTLSIFMEEFCPELVRKKLTFKLIENAIREHHRKTGVIPTDRTNGNVPGLEGTWKAISLAFLFAGRGIAEDPEWKQREKWTFNIFKNEFCSDILRKNLTFKNIERAVRAWHKKTGIIPTSKLKEEVPVLGGTWMAVNAALNYGNRGIAQDPHWKQQKQWTLTKEP